MSEGEYNDFSKKVDKTIMMRQIGTVASESESRKGSDNEEDI